MSDGALSQEEINSLLAGLDSGPAPGGAPAAAPAARAASAVPPQVAQAFKALIDTTLGTQSQNLSMITGLPVNLASPAVDGASRDGLLRELPRRSSRFPCPSRAPSPASTSS